MVENEQSKNLSEIQAQWVTVRGRIRQKIGDAQFKSWIKMIVLEDYDDQKVILSVPSNFIRTRIIEQYLDIIKSAITGKNHLEEEKNLNYIKQTLKDNVEINVEKEDE